MVKDGDLEIRRAALLTLSTFLASAAGILDLQIKILATVLLPWTLM